MSLDIIHNSIFDNNISIIEYCVSMHQIKNIYESNTTIFTDNEKRAINTHIDEYIKIYQYFDNEFFNNENFIKMRDDLIKEQHQIFREFNSQFDTNHFNKIIKLFFISLYLETDIYYQNIDSRNWDDGKNMFRNIFDKLIENVENFKLYYTNVDKFFLLEIIKKNKHIFTVLFDIFRDIYHYPIDNIDNIVNQYGNIISIKQMIHPI